MNEKISGDGNSRSPVDWRDEYLREYFRKPGRVRTNEQWEELIRTNTPKDAKVLEIGGGPVEWTTRILRERATEIIGIDVDKVVQSNPHLDKAIVYDGGAFPVPDARFNLAISRWVHEHLPDPASHFKEVERALAPGGTYVFRTINLHHYVALVARMVPHSVQVPMARWLRHVSPDDHDPYPTFYRANTRRQITRLCRDAGLEVVMLRMTESYPSYGMGSKLLFNVFMQYERLVNSSDRWQGMRHIIDCVARKPARQ